MKPATSHCLHVLTKLQRGSAFGWIAPAEASDNAPQATYFVIPLDQEGKAFPGYKAEVVRYEGKGQHGYTTEAVLTEKGAGRFQLTVDNRSIGFHAAQTPARLRAVRYIGRLRHPDFTYRLHEIEPDDPSIMDELLLSSGLVITGCDPFQCYEGLDGAPGTTATEMVLRTQEVPRSTPINPVQFAHNVCDEFLRYIFSAFRFSDPELAQQAGKLLDRPSSLDIPLVQGPFRQFSEHRGVSASCPMDRQVHPCHSRDARAEGRGR